MDLAVNPPVQPMLAKRVEVLPEGPDWIYEPKWDGFRVIVFRDGDELLLQSREEKPLDRYFPELRAPLLAWLPRRCVLLFGQEGPGLSDAARAACDQLFSIAQYGSTRSINAGVASAVAMHAWIRAYAGPPPG